MFILEITADEKRLGYEQLGSRLDYFDALIIVEAKKGNTKRVKEIAKAVAPIESLRHKLLNADLKEV